MKRSSVFLIAIVTAVCGCRVSSPLPVRLPDGPHPCVFLTPEEQTAARALVQTEAWARSVRDGLVGQADAVAAATLDIPHAGGQYTHLFSCENDGAGLESRSPTEHVCPRCGRVYTGYPYDQVYISNRHNFWLGGLETLGWAYALEPKPEYAQRVRDVLVEYSTFYSDLELHDKYNRKGSARARLFAQTLDEAVSLCHICVGYDMTYDAPCFSAEDRAAIENGLLRPMCETIIPNLRLVNNWQSWHNAAVGCTGFLLRDADLVDWAINGWSGFLYQMDWSVLSSGMWYEGSPSYHWYALRALVYLMEAAERAGMDVYALPIVKKLFDAPERQLFPDFTFPAINDSDRSSVVEARGYYEIAYRRYGDEAYLPLLAPRNTYEALFWGATPPEGTPPPIPLVTSNSIPEGLAILRDRDNQTALFLDYSANLSGHAHPAKLGVILYAQGDERLVDPGRLSYGNPMHGGWYRQTIAHNTVVVNEQSQTALSCDLRAFGSNDVFSAVRVAAKAYGGLQQFDRIVVLCGNTIIDVFQCRALLASKFDYPLHFRGEVFGLPDWEPLAALSDATGYVMLEDVRHMQDPAARFDVDTGGNNRIHAQVLDISDTYYATGLGYGASERIPMVLRRQEGNEALFVTVLNLGSVGDTPQEAAMTRNEGDISIRTGDLEAIIGSTTVIVTGGQRYQVTRSGVVPLGAAS